MDIDKIIRKILEIDDLVSKKHTHSNKSIIDSITQALIDNWNAAYTHISDAVKHITSTERANWNDANSKKHTHSNKTILDFISQTNLNNWDDKYSKNEVDNKINQVVSNMDWKEAVTTFNDLATTYPTPEDGWTVNVKDTDITYRYDGSAWISISANSIPLASATVDGKMSKSDKSKLDGIAFNANNYVHPANHPSNMITEDATHRFTTDTEKSNWNDANAKKHTHSNGSILNSITQALIDTWNAAYTHVSDTIRHITSSERTNWNEAYSKKHDHSNKSIIDTITQVLIDKWNAAYSHISDDVKHITSDERSLWNSVSNKFNSSGGDITGNVKFPNDSKVEWNRNTDYARISFKNTGDGDTDSYMQFLMGDNGNEYFKFDSVSGSTTTELLTIKSDYLRFKGNKVYHESNKPTPADIGASATGHTHTKSQVTDMPTKLSEFTNDAGFITQTDVDTSQNHTHANKSLLDTLTQTLINNWNAAYSHISDSVKHITSSERTLWNTVSNKLDSTANAVSASKLATARTISLTGDVTGSTTFDGSGNVSMTAIVADDSHNHIISNVDGLQTALDSKLNLTGGTLDNGTSTTLNIKCDDGGEATLNLMGDNQGTGKLFVGQSSTHGGGIEYNGDNSPVTTGAGSDYITLYRRSSGVEYWTARNNQGNNDWEFRGDVTAPKFSGALSGNASTATKWETSRTLTLTDDVTGSVSFDGSANASLSATTRKIAFVGSDLASSNGWYKVASQTMSGYGNTNITFAITSTYASYCSGILQLQIRSDNTSIWCPTLKWHSRIGFNTSHFIVVISGMIWTLYVYRDVSQYGRIMFEVLTESSINNKISNITLVNNYTMETTTPTATVTSSDGSTVNTANKLTTARTISLTGDVSGSATFDGSVNASITATVADNSHNHTSLTGVTQISGAYGTILKSIDEWLRLNDDSSHSNGIYCGSGILRTDGEFQVGSSGSVFKVNGTTMSYKGTDVSLSNHNHDSVYVKKGMTWNDLEGV